MKHSLKTLIAALFAAAALLSAADCSGGQTAPDTTVQTEDASAVTKVTVPEGGWKSGKKYRGGVFEGSGYGKNGLITVEITLHEDRIVDVQIVSSSETETHLQQAFSRLRGYIIGCSSTQEIGEIDAVSGATMSSEGILAAVRDALNSAAK